MESTNEEDHCKQFRNTAFSSPFLSFTYSTDFQVSNQEPIQGHKRLVYGEFPQEHLVSQSFLGQEHTYTFPTMSLSVPNRSRERTQMCMASDVLRSIIPMSSRLCSYVNEHVITRLKLHVSSPCLFRVNVRVDQELHLVTFPRISDLWRNVAYNQATCLSLGEPSSTLKGIKFYILHPSHARSLP